MPSMQTSYYKGAVQRNKYLRYLGGLPPHLGALAEGTAADGGPMGATPAAPPAGSPATQTVMIRLTPHVMMSTLNYLQGLTR